MRQQASTCPSCLAEEGDGAAGNGDDTRVKRRSPLAAQGQRHELVDEEVFDRGRVTAFGWVCDDYRAVRRYVEIGKPGKSKQVTGIRPVKLGPDTAVLERVAVEWRNLQLRLGLHLPDAIVDYSFVSHASTCRTKDEVALAEGNRSG